MNPQRVRAHQCPGCLTTAGRPLLYMQPKLIGGHPPTGGIKSPCSRKMIHRRKESAQEVGLSQLGSERGGEGGERERARTKCRTSLFSGLQFVWPLSVSSLRPSFKRGRTYLKVQGEIPPREGWQIRRSLNRVPRKGTFDPCLSIPPHFPFKASSCFPDF